MKDIHYDNLIDHLLEIVPEVKSEYERNAAFYQQSKLSEKDLLELRSISNLHGLGEPIGKPGVTIVFEEILIPFLVSLISDKNQLKRLKELMGWIESLIEVEDRRVRDAIVTSICEPLVTNYRSKLEYFVPHMGSKTKKLCKEVFSFFKPDEKTQKLLS